MPLFVLPIMACSPNLLITEDTEVRYLVSLVTSIMIQYPFLA